MATSIGTVRATITVAPSSTSSARALPCSPSTNHVAPLPARVGAVPIRRRDEVAPLGEAGFHHERCCFEIVAARTCRPAEVVPRPVGRRCADGERWDHEGHHDVDVGERFDDLADAGDPCSTADEAEGDVGAEPCRGGEVVGGGPNPAQRRTAAASVEPPPRPPPWGIRLSMVTCAWRPARSQCPGDEVRIVERHPGGEGAGGRQPATGGVDRRGRRGGRG